MTSKSLKSTIISRMCIVAIFAALTFLATAFIVIPISGGAGYLNFSDLFILLVATFVDPISGGLVGLIGAGLADLQAGFAAFMPFTMVIKFMEGLVAGYLMRIFKKGAWRYISFLLAALFMAVAYMVPDLILTDVSIMWLDLPFNILQGIVNSILAFILYVALEKSNIRRNLKI